jgi:hypothetical protein
VKDSLPEGNFRDSTLMPKCSDYFTNAIEESTSVTDFHLAYGSYQSSGYFVKYVSFQGDSSQTREIIRMSQHVLPEASVQNQNEGTHWSSESQRGISYGNL